MRRPNFFLIGGPKCGTTSVYHYLRRHPHVFMSDPKEPHYLASDLGNYRRIVDGREYASLFAASSDKHQVVGEATVWYFLSQTAVRKIEADYPHSKIAVILRNPLDMLPSLHQQFVYNRFENLVDFGAAWNRRHERSLGRQIPPLCPVDWFLQYEMIGRIGDHLRRLVNSISTCRLKVLFFDDLCKTPDLFVDELLRFLDLDPLKGNSVPLHNARREVCWQVLADLQAASLQMSPRLLQLGRRLRLDRVHRIVKRWNTRPSHRAHLPEDLRREMADVFADDLRIVEEITGRSLTHWTAPVDGAVHREVCSIERGDSR